ncbi:MAG: hypothetical protein Q8907_08500 [Bacteroidota bacterium]|nr:hypothetical protein [Bacteroidota bacterium]MDP4227369.1 hypothetical protein [Bacteroidota bacterium]MDP4274302.1 hypothetical protein [Bacteroidota bacterium]
MAIKKLKILGISVGDRIKAVEELQQVLTNYADSIKTRFGFHELNQNVCSRRAIILLELAGNPNVWNDLETDLKEIEDVQVKEMTFFI